MGNTLVYQDPLLVKEHFLVTNAGKDADIAVPIASELGQIEANNCPLT
jgi:hypothetical protein